MDGNDKPQAEERIGRILSEAIGEEISREPEVSITPQELKRLAAESGKKARRKKRIFRGAVAVCCIALGIFLPLNMAPTTAEKNTKTHAESQGDTVVIRQGDTEGSVGSKQIVETDWDKVQSLAKEVEDLYIPGYVPEGYEFERAVLEIDKDTYRAVYYFKDKERKILSISQTKSSNSDATSIYLEQHNFQIKTNKGILRISEGDETIIQGTLQNAQIKFVIKGCIDKRQCIQIINQLTKVEEKSK